MRDQVFQYYPLIGGGKFGVERQPMNACHSKEQAFRCAQLLFAEHDARCISPAFQQRSQAPSLPALQHSLPHLWQQADKHVQRHR